MPKKGYKQTEEHRRKYTEALMGHIVTKETRRKISEALAGRELSKEHRGKLSEVMMGHIVTKETIKKLSGENHPRYWLGKKRPEHSKAMLGYEVSNETRRKMSDSRSGEKHWNWQNGSSFEPYGIEFNEGLKENIRKRDDHICQILDCRKKQNGRRFPVHHIDYDKRNNKKSNLITLCLPCHIKTNFAREYWKNYFMLIIRGVNETST